MIFVDVVSDKLLVDYVFHLVQPSVPPEFIHVETEVDVS